jgi:two-component system sensor histidine kinase PhcS
MAKLKLQNHEEIRRAFLQNERDVWIRNFRVASILAFIFVPAGSSLDWFVYHSHFVEFAKLRLLCSAFLLFIWWFVTTTIGGKYYRILGWILPALPTFFISLMIYRTTGAESPYYAGLNLVLLGAAIILRWTLLDSIVVFFEVMSLYLAACLLRNDTIDVRIFFNNVYFLFVTGVFVVIGSHFYNLLRFSEFAFQYELNKSKQDLEAANLKLAEQNAALEKANRDIKEAEAQLVQSEKMASLGLLAAKIAHEIRNPLNYARMNLDTLRKRFKGLPPEQHAEAGAIVADMSDGFTRIDSIVSDLLTFSQPGGQEPEPVDVAHIFKTTLRYVSNQLQEKNIQLEHNLTLGHLIWVNRQQFNQVLVNLLENSIDALGAKQFSGGDRPTITVSCRRENDRQLISIRDNGAGIDPQNLAKIFDPFFTTKDIGKGTGLGLSICFGIVRGYGGNLRVESEPGKFCEFIIDLPANDPSKPAHGNA